MVKRLICWTAHVAASSSTKQPFINLKEHPDEPALRRLVDALQDDDFGVRWEAAAALAGLGKPALVHLLEALIDPERAGNPRLREGAYQVLHHNKSPDLPASIRKLVAALSNLYSASSSSEERRLRRAYMSAWVRLFRDD